MRNKIDREAEARDIERGDRVLSVLKPLFTHAVAQKIIRRDFPHQPETEVFDILSAYNSESEEHSWRIRLDALKLSDGSLPELQQQISTANEDFRDLVLPAENPRLLDMGVVAYADSSEDEKDRIANSDLNEYLAWIQKP